jgi:hypothetical protein
VALTVGELVGYIDLKNDRWDRGMASAHRDLNRLGTRFKKVTDSIDFSKLAGFVSAAGSAGLAVVKMGGKFLASSAAVAGGISVIQAVPPVLAVVVGASVAAAGALTALAQGGIVAKVGLTGMGDALKGDTEAMKRLHPEAQKVVTVLQGFKKPLDDIRRSVQGKIFEGLADHIKDLGGKWMPLLKTAGDKTAETLNDLALGAVELGQSPVFQANFTKIAESNARSFTYLGAAGFSIVNAFTAIIAAAGPLTERISKGISDVAAKFAEWVLQAQQSGKLEEFFNKVGDSISNVITFFKNFKRVWDTEIWPFIQSVGPQFTAMMEQAKATVGAGIQTLTEFWRHHKDEVAEFLRGLMDTIRGGLLIIQGIFTTATGIITGDSKKASDGINQIWAGGLETLKGVIRASMTTATDSMRAGIRDMVGEFLGGIGKIVNGAALATSWIPGVGSDLRRAADAFNKFAYDANVAISGIKDRTVIVDADVSRFQAAMRAVGAQQGIAGGSPASASVLLRRKSAGGNWLRAGEASWVGERGKEIWVPSTPGRILSNSDAMKALRARDKASGDTHWHIGGIHTAANADAVNAQLNRMLLLAGA